MSELGVHTATAQDLSLTVATLKELVNMSNAQGGRKEFQKYAPNKRKPRQPRLQRLTVQQAPHSAPLPGRNIVRRRINYGELDGMGSGGVQSSNPVDATMQQRRESYVRQQQQLSTMSSRSSAAAAPAPIVAPQAPHAPVQQQYAAPKAPVAPHAPHAPQAPRAPASAATQPPSSAPPPPPPGPPTDLPPPPPPGVLGAPPGPPPGPPPPAPAAQGAPLPPPPPPADAVVVEEEEEDPPFALEPDLAMDMQGPASAGFDVGGPGLFDTFSADTGAAGSAAPGGTMSLQGPVLSRATAVYDYEATRADELSFSEGQVSRQAS